MTAACAFDLHAPTFRHKLSDAYKANRKGMPEDLALQLPYAHRLAEALGFTVVELEGYEADDVIGSLAKKAEDSGVHAYILTGDRDSLQLLSDSVSVILTKTKEDILYTPERFNEECGISPSAVRRCESADGGLLRQYPRGCRNRRKDPH